MPIKSFRGLIADGGQDIVPLSTNNGSTGYRIKKLTIFPNKPGHTTSAESVVQIFSIQQTTVLTTAATVDFSEGELLAVSYAYDASGTVAKQINAGNMLSPSR